MKKIITIVLLLISNHILADQVGSSETKNTLKPKLEEVVENPTLKNLSGALSSFSFYSKFTYKGGSLSHPSSALRPNITNSAKKPSLQSMTGQLGAKYRITKKDSISVQVGTSMTTPFHSEFKTRDTSIQKDFDDNHQNLEFDNPKISYFRTYNLGFTQNVTFLTFEKFTQNTYTEYGYNSNIQLQHAIAIPLAKSFYIAGTFAYQQAFFDKSSLYIPAYKKSLSLAPYQIQRNYKTSISMEYYLRSHIALRAQTDIASYEQTRNNSFSDVEKNANQQLLAMTYFFSRDISIAPSATFIYDDIRSDKTNLGLTLYMNL